MLGCLINCPDNCGTPTVVILTVKLLFNSIISISTPNSKFIMTIDIKDFYLMTPMDCYEYFRMKLKLFPQDIINKYALRDKVDADGNVFCKVQRGIMASHRLAPLRKNSSPKAFTKQDTSRAPSHQDTGIMTGAPSVSPLLLTILV